MRKHSTHNLGLKFIALILAVLTWIYVNYHELVKSGAKTFSTNQTE